MPHSSALFDLVRYVSSDDDAAWLFDRLAIAPELSDWAGDAVPRASVAMALNLLLYRDVVAAVPAAQDYVAMAAEEGRRILFDHGALRSILFEDGSATDGHLAFDRFLKPLGYEVAADYPLPRLKMTGRAYCHIDHPETVPQFFVSELHVDQFSETFAAAAHGVFDSWADPLDGASVARLATLARDGALPRADVVSLADAEITFEGIEGDFCQRELLFGGDQRIALVHVEVPAGQEMEDRNRREQDRPAENAVVHQRR